MTRITGRTGAWRFTMASIQLQRVDPDMNRRQFKFGLLGAAGAIGPGRFSFASPAPLRVNGARLMDHINALAEFGKNPQGGVSRVAYSEADRQGREYVLGLMRAAKLETSIDAAGNIIGRRRESSETKLRPILLGSHVDSVPEGGNYDGDVGSLGAIEVAQALAERRYSNRHPLHAVIWCDEESGLTGSRGFIGDLPDEELRRPGRDGVPLADKIKP